MTRVRRPFAVVAGVVAVLGMVATVLATWASSVLFDPEPFGDAVDATLSEPEVADAVGGYVADQVLAAVDQASLLDERVPAELLDLVVDGVRELIIDRISDLLADDDVRGAVVVAAEASHRAVLRVLEDGRVLDGVTADNAGDVTLNLLPLLARGLDVLGDRGLSVVDVPDLDPADPADRHIVQLEEALGRSLPDDLGQLVVYRSEKVGEARFAVARAQQALVLFRSSVLAIIGLTVLAIGACVGLATRRPRAVAFLAAGAVLAMGVARLVIDRIVRDAPALAADPGARAAIGSMVSTLANGLSDLVTIVFLVGVASLAGAASLNRFRTPASSSTSPEVLG